MLNKKRVITPYPPVSSGKKRKLSRLELQIHDMLTQQLENLASKLETQANEMAQGTISEGDFADRADKSSRQSKRLALEHLWQSTRAKVERAMSRLEEGTYGLCERCEVLIPRERLMAVPATTLCVECARRQGRRRAN